MLCEDTCLSEYCWVLDTIWKQPLLLSGLVQYHYAVWVDFTNGLDTMVLCEDFWFVVIRRHKTSAAVREVMAYVSGHALMLCDDLTFCAWLGLTLLFYVKTVDAVVTCEGTSLCTGEKDWYLAAFLEIVVNVKFFNALTQLESRQWRWIVRFGMMTPMWTCWLNQWIWYLHAIVLFIWRFLRLISTPQFVLSSLSAGDVVVDPCSLPIVSGPCSENIARFAYNAFTETCISFGFGGCNGNENNFASMADCQDRCVSKYCFVLFCFFSRKMIVSVEIIFRLHLLANEEILKYCGFLNRNITWLETYFEF